MRTFVLLSAFLASFAQAYPITLEFTGRVSSIDLHDQATGNPLNIDPDSPFYFNGQQIFSGDSRVAGTFTFDTESNHYNYDCSKVLNVSYQMNLEGVTYSRVPARSCTDDFDVDIDRISAHFEGPALQQSSGPNSSIQNFVFNLANGVFTGGTFILDYMIGDGLAGTGIRGVFDSISFASVPEPGVWTLVLTGFACVGLLRRYRNNSRR